MLTFHSFVIFFISFIHAINSNAITSSKANGIQPSILMVHAIIRHGDRNLKDVCPNDPWKDLNYWPEGYGQLTNIGKLQTFKLGEWLANRYQPLFPNGYLAKTVKIYSSEFDRTMMSAAACLAGMFPPKEQQIWNSNLLWQPIPINMLAKDVDTKLFHTLKMCKLGKELYNEYLSSEEVQQISRTYQQALDYAKFYCGATTNNIFTQAQRTYDSFSLQIMKNNTIPAQALAVYNDLEKLSLFSLKSYSATPQLARLRVGFLIKDIFDNFKNKTEGSEQKNFILYSSHITTIVPVLSSLGIYDNELVPYAACVMFELYEENGEFYVQIAYKKEDEFTVLNIPDCGTKCPLEEIINKYQAILPENDYETECKNKD